MSMSYSSLWLFFDVQEAACVTILPLEGNRQTCLLEYSPPNLTSLQSYLPAKFKIIMIVIFLFKITFLTVLLSEKVLNQVKLMIFNGILNLFV